jgi:tetratricopeptide (TPR) repeat protein
MHIRGMKSLFPKPFEFLSPAHLQAVYEAVASGSIVSKGSKPLKLWIKGADYYSQGNPQKARESWQELVCRDPGSCDGWYGLALVSGRDIEKLLPIYNAMALTKERFLSEVSEAPLALTPTLYWKPLGGSAYPAKTKEDIEAAYAGLLAFAGRDEEARSWLARLFSGWQRSAVEAYLAYEAENYHQCVASLQAMAKAKNQGEDPEVSLLLADCYRRLGMTQVAIEAYEKVINEDSIWGVSINPSEMRDIRFDARYGLAHLYKENGQEEKARHELERIYALDASFRNVSDLLGASQKTGQLPSDGVFEALTSQLGDIGQDVVWPDER